MSIKKILMERDGMEASAADDLIREARAELMDFIAEGDMESAEDICADWFGLEPDYLIAVLASLIAELEA